ncbi:UNKNOWN [Stylonychia lemnae]|uniref:Syndetin C-terminal domain-containing protein n=1 Tax=Stylonychia lemnae TaxID=5949 RepID=A0A077ZM56_STYLE|nr:UNKNOWN [Stylonychia lemnae]|eukprot:CDW71082.1 UNKNOWN [Stylonychia lemnae]
MMISDSKAFSSIFKTPDKFEIKFDDEDFSKYENDDDELQESDNKYFSSPADKDSELSFIDYLKQNSHQSQIQALIDKYHYGANSNNNSNNQRNDENFRLKKQMKSIKEEVLDILMSLPNSDDVLSNIDESYHLPSIEINQIQMFKKEFSQLSIPIDIFEITERCEDLERVQKVISYQLSFSVMKNSDKFVEGVTNIKGIQDDLQIVKEISQNSTQTVEFIRKKIAITMYKAIFLKRKQKRLQIVKDITVKVLKQFCDNEIQVKKLLQKHDFKKALILSAQSINQITEFQQQFSFSCLELLKDKFQLLVLNVKDKLAQGLNLLILKYDQQLYDKILKANQQLCNDQKLNFSEYIANNIKDKIRQNVTQSMKRSLLKYQKNFEQLQLIGINYQNPRIKLGTLSKMLDKTYYLQAICELYKTLSNLMYNHHLITRYHSLSDNVLSEEQNDIIRYQLVQDRKSFWQYIQEKLINFFQSTQELADDLSIRELFDLLMLSNRFIDMGQEFGGDDESSQVSLLRYLSNDLSNKYIEDFKNFHIQNVKNLLEREEWDRLPIPDNFVIKEIEDPFAEYPKHMDQLLNVFSSQSRPSIAGMEVRDSQLPDIGNLSKKKSSKIVSHFSQFAVSNPFEQIQFVSAQKEQRHDVADKNESFIICMTEQEMSDDEGNRSYDEDDMIDIGDEDMKSGGLELQYKQGINQFDNGVQKSLTFYQQQSKIKFDKNMILSLSGLNIIKSTIAKYIELMNVCRHKSFDIFINLCQSFELYFFSAFHMFAQSQQYKRLFEDSVYENVDPNLEDLSKYQDLHELYIFQQRYKYLKNFLIRVRNFVEQNQSSQQLNCSIQSNPVLSILIKTLPNAQIFELLNRFEQDVQYSLYKTIVCVESVLFVYEQISSKRNLIKRLVNTQQQAYVIQYFNSLDQTINEFRHFLYYQNIHEVVPLDLSIQNVGNINWTLKSKKTDISSYIEKVIQSIDLFASKTLTEIFKKGEGVSQAPEIIQKRMISISTDYIAQTIIESIAQIKKCNDFGRESMKQDINYLRNIVQMKVLDCPSQLLNLIAFVEAYFLSREELLDFVKRNSDSNFTYKQLKNLLSICQCLNIGIKSSEKKEFYTNVDIFFRDYFTTFMLQNKSSHQL